MNNFYYSIQNITVVNNMSIVRSTERRNKMPNLSHSELNSIREVVTCHLTTASKLNSFSEACEDQQIKQMLGQASQQARQSAQNLIQML